MCRILLAAALACAVARSAAAEVNPAADWVQLTKLSAPRGVYFDTQFYPDQNSRVVLTVDVKGTSEYWFGAWNSNWNSQAFALGNDGAGVYVGYGNSGSGTDREPVPNGVHTVELDRGVYKLDGVVKRSAGTYTFKLTYPLLLCAQNRRGTVYPHPNQGALVLHAVQLYDNGTCVGDFVPCRRRSDGVVGLGDFERGIFLSPKGGAATGGDLVNPSLGPVIAHWTNATGDGDVANAANWACTNDYNEAVASVPTAESTVFLPNDRVFNCTNGAPFVCRRLVLPTSLAGDSDWRGLGGDVSITGTLNLNGHRLYLSSLAGTGSIVGDEYQLLDSVRAPNGALVDTGFTPNSKTRVVMDLTVGGTSENWFGCGGPGTNWWKDRAFSLCNDGRGVYVGYGTDSGTYQSNQGLTVLPVGSRYTIDLNRNVFRYSAHGSGVTNIWTTRAASTFTSVYTLYLFANHQGSGENNTFKSDNNPTCHSCQIYDDGVLVRDYVPARRKADGVAGLIDRVHGNAFYPSARTTALVAGNVVGDQDNGGELVLDLPEGATSTPPTVDVGVPVVGAKQWIGGEEGDWDVADNWDGGSVPAAGELVQVRGTVQLTYGNGGAKVRNLLVRVGADGALEYLAGTVWSEVKCSVKRVRAGVPITVEVKDFAGFHSAQTARIQWQRGTAATKDYAVVAEGDTYTPSADDYEHWVKCVASDDTGVFFEKEFFCSPLPVIYLATDDGQTPTQNKEKHDGTLFVQGNEEWKSQYDGAMTINVRGNSTAKEPKKPWKIKLDDKTKMFGLPKSKHWVLLANYYDETNLRNKLAYDFANDIGSFGMRSTWVECVLNGNWQGLYLFCEHVRIAGDRVAIYDWENAGEDAADAVAAAEGFPKADKKALEKLMTDNFDWVTTGTVAYTNRVFALGDYVSDFVNVTNNLSGGYLFQFEYDEWYGEQPWFVVKSPVASPTLELHPMLASPEGMKTNARAKSYCQDFLQKYGDATTSVDGYSGEGRPLADYCDLESMVTYFLVVEMFGNDDARYRSIFAYKDRDRPMKYGPVWDYDFGVGNYQMAYNPEAWLANYHKACVYKEWADDPWFCTLLWTRYRRVARPAFAEIIRDGGLIDQYYEQLRIPAEVNDAKWHHHYGYRGGIYGTGSHPGLKAFFTTRLAWMDRQFTDVPTLMASLKAGTRSTPSAKPYTPDAQSLPIRLLNAPEGWVPQCETLRLEIALGNASAATVGVYANGLKVGAPRPVVDGKIAARIPTALLTAGPNEPNCVSFAAFDASGACIARNYALVWVDWTKQGFQFIIR